MWPSDDATRCSPYKYKDKPNGLLEPAGMSWSSTHLGRAGRHACREGFIVGITIRRKNDMSRAPI
jgi:hypothetical protein